MLVLDRVTRRFGVTVAVSNVSVEIEPGSFVGVVGRSGAGKSTLLRMINRLIDPSEGRIAFDGVDVTALRGRQLREWRARAAMIFQQFNLSPRLDVLTNVLVGASTDIPQARRLFQLYTKTERLRAAAALDDLDLLEKALARAERLSGGEQQRVAIARALMQRPRLILADEPIASLDPRNARVVMDTLKRINVERGITVLCNLHSLEMTRSYATRAIGLRQGRVVFDGPIAGLTDTAAAEIYGGMIGSEPEELSVAA
jgi:phosphonate transport system ATP-binding protein